MTVEILAGNVARCTVTFDPDAGTVTAPTCVYQSPRGTETNLTPVAGVANIFHADATIVVGEASGTARFRWHSASPLITAEETFDVERSAFPT